MNSESEKQLQTKIVKNSSSTITKSHNFYKLKIRSRDNLVQSMCEARRPLAHDRRTVILST